MCLLRVFFVKSHHEMAGGTFVVLLLQTVQHGHYLLFFFFLSWKEKEEVPYLDWEDEDTPPWLLLGRGRERRCLLVVLTCSTRFSSVKTIVVVLLPRHTWVYLRNRMRDMVTWPGNKH